MARSGFWGMVDDQRPAGAESENTSTANAPIQSVSPAAPSAARGLGRIDSIDILRGLVMVIMALDHTRDFFTNLRFEPENLANTYYALFFTRWITHFCAPLFFFLAGTGAFFYGRRRTPEQLSLLLWTRGLWLILLEFTVIGTAWSFQFPWGFFGVIWALGASMVIMAAAVRLPVRWLAGISIAVIATHDLFDRVRPNSSASMDLEPAACAPVCDAAVSDSRVRTFSDCSVSRGHGRGVRVWNSLLDGA